MQDDCCTCRHYCAQIAADPNAKQQHTGCLHIPLLMSGHMYCTSKRLAPSRGQSQVMLPSANYGSFLFASLLWFPLHDLCHQVIAFENQSVKKMAHAVGSWGGLSFWQTVVTFLWEFCVEGKMSRRRKKCGSKQISAAEKQIVSSGNDVTGSLFAWPDPALLPLTSKSESGDDRDRK